MLLPIARVLALGACLSWLAACGELKADSAALTARNAAPMEGLDCAACHGYPLKDRNHDYHLFDIVGNRELNGAVTCLDCHAQSLRSVPVVLFDSLYQHPDGGKYGTADFPNPGDTTQATATYPSYVIRSLPLYRIDTLLQNHPVAASPRAGAKPAFQEYLTALAHMNGKVDVVFDPRISDTAKFMGASASYNPKQESCSAVACHPGEKIYSFGSMAKNLPQLINGLKVGEPQP